MFLQLYISKTPNSTVIFLNFNDENKILYISNNYNQN